MDKVTFITPGFAVMGATTPEDFAAAAAAGFRAVINNRPDGEDLNQLTAAEGADLARSAGLQYRHIPARMPDVLSDEVVGPMREALDSFEGPILAHCKTGLRSVVAWAAAQARTEPVDDVLETLRQAGFQLDHLRDELEEQAGRPPA